MPELVPMPKLGFDMAEGTLVRKVKKEGEAVTKGEVLAEIETDKATVEVEAPATGVVKGWLVEEGQAVPVGALMAVIAAPDETVDLGTLSAGGKPKAAEPVVSPSASHPPAGSANQPAITTLPTAASEPLAAPGRVFASPLARKMAAEAKLDLRQIHGAGPHGRIQKKDVEAHLLAPQTAAQMPATSPLAAGAPADQPVPLTRLRQIIARRMTESVQTVPQFYVTVQANMAPAMELRRQLNELLPDERKVSVNDLIIKAAALALRQFPNLNATFAGDKTIRKGHINIGIAVGVENGLLTVVVKDADRKSLAEIAVEAKVMIGRARAGKVQQADIEDSTFSVSNLGMYDVEHFVAIINPPEAAILATGTVQAVPTVQNGAVVPGQQLKATLSADHRVTDGVEAAQFMQAFKKNLETPLNLLL